MRPENHISAAPVLLAAALLFPSCAPSPAEPSACDGLADKTLGITRDDYSDCSGEIMAELDGLELYLERFVRQDDEEAGPTAKKHAARLRHLMAQVGFQADVYRDMGSGELVQRWPDSNMRWFNKEVSNAAAQFISGLRYPNEDNLRRGSEHYENARQAYSRFRR